MGRRVVRLLRQSLPEVQVLTAGRGDANDRRLDVHAPEDHYASLRSVNVLINTVGPFTYDPAPIVGACLDCGVHYIDIAETAPFMAQANRAGKVAVLPGCSTVPGLIEVLSRRWHRHQVRAQLSIGTSNESSPTLLYSMFEPVGREGWFNRVWWREHPGMKARRYGNYPGAGFEFGFGFDRPGYTTALWLLAPLVGATPRPVLKAVARVANPLIPLARPFGTKVGILSVDVPGDPANSIEVRACDNGLDVPAWPSVWAAGELLKAPFAARRLSELVTPASAVERLKAAGYEVVENS